MTLRSYLVALTLAALLPVAVFSVLQLLLLVQHERDTFRRGAEDRALAMTVAVDTELYGSISTLEAMAVSPALDESSLVTFRQLSESILHSQADWANINLALPGGKQLMNLMVPVGQPLADIGAIDDSFHRLVGTRAPVVSDLAYGPTTKRWGFAVRAPVMRDGEVRYVISAGLRPEGIGRILRAQHLPSEWTSMVLDRNARIIFHSEGGSALGQSVPDTLRQAVLGSPSGWLRSRQDEANVYHAFRRAERSGWTVALAVPRSAVEEAAWRGATVLAIGLAAAIALAIFLARAISRRIAKPIMALSAATEAVARGAPEEVPQPRAVAEVRALAAALAAAAHAARERQGLIEREKDALQAADRAKDEFLAMLSHELRNPLAALSTAAHVVKLAPPGSEAAIKARAVIERQTKHMAHLVGDLLDISRVVMGKIGLERERIDLAGLVSGVVGTWRASGRLERHQVTVETAATWVDADRARIEQIVSNLLDNAIKFTPAGRRIGLTVRKEGESAVLQVADEGEGLAPGAAERVFGLFVQGERGLDRAKGGLGVGLALVRRLTELHGGTVSASSAGTGRGATFTVRLPAVLPSAAPHAPERRLPQAPRRVLIVEDNDDARNMLFEALAFSGHQVREVRDGASALAAAAESPPDVALIDIGLPDLDGYEVARRMRAAPGGRRIGLIAITGYGQPEDQRRAYEAGFDAHLTKPVAPERLKQVIAGFR
jgi:signal transduction histidine kinase